MKLAITKVRPKYTAEWVSSTKIRRCTAESIQQLIEKLWMLIDKHLLTDDEWSDIIRMDKNVKRGILFESDQPINLVIVKGDHIIRK